VTTDDASERRCGHDGGDGPERLTREVRALALLALDHLDPLIARLRDAVVRSSPNGLTHEPDHARPPTGPCTACPVCMVLAVVRREHPELAERFGVHAAGLLAALREALDGQPPADNPAPAPQPPRVQHIPVERSAGGEPC
jgi:hypothetical protein